MKLPFNLLMLSLLLFSSAVFGQTEVNLAPFSINLTAHPESLAGYERFSRGSAVAEFSPTVSVHTFFEPNWNWFVQTSLVSFSYNLNYNPSSIYSVPLYGNRLHYSRLDLAILLGAEYCTSPVSEHKINLRMALSGGIWGRMIQTHSDLLNEGQPGLNSRVGVDFPLKQNYLGLYFNYGFRVVDNFYMQQAGISIAYNFAFNTL